MRLAADRLDHAYQGSPPLFSDLSFEMGPSDLFAVTGPSGSGKSTLLSLLGGLIVPSSGIVHRDGIQRSIWVLQNPHGVARRTVLDHVALPLLAAGHHRSAACSRATAILGEFGLGDLHHALFRDLSGGEAQRVMLARAVAANADLLLVDEPTAQLDSTSAAAVTAVLHRLTSRGAIVVVATHDLRVVEACDDTIDLGVC